MCLLGETHLLDGQDLFVVDIFELVFGEQLVSIGVDKTARSCSISAANHVAAMYNEHEMKACIPALSARIC